jgi:hypothetical protein
MKRLVLIALLALQGPVVFAQPDAGDYVDVSIRIFDSVDALPASEATPAEETTVEATVTPEVRLAERRYLPMFLRYRLEASGLFGAVRVLPELDNSAQLSIEATILQSDGAQLTLDLKAVDSTGRTWLDQRYEGAARSSVTVTGDPLAEDDFAWLFAAIVRDLVAVQASLTTAQRDEIRTVALLRYGKGLVPASFDGYLQDNPDGTVSILRLPAANDPLLQRIAQIREHEYLFIDVVDAEYQRFFGDIKPVYDMWRRFQREQSSSAADFATREAGASSGYARGSYYALRESYDNYGWAKVQDLYLDELREGFANEVEPTEIALKDSLYKLTGTMEQQYREWRSILAELYALETE